MSTKRLCISLSVHAVPRSAPHSRAPCLVSTIVRGDQHQHHQHQHNHDQRRSFSLSHARHVGTAKHNVSAKRNSAPAISLMSKKLAKEAERDGSTIEHFGLMPGTFVPPTGSNLPPWTAFQARREIEWWRFKGVWISWLKNLWTANFLIRPKLNLELGKVPTLAVKLYKDMYTHFARGDLESIKHTLAPGLMGSLSARLGQRGAQTHMQWEMEKLLSEPKVVVHQFVLTNPMAPKDNQMGLQQAVVRIHSRQILMKVQRVVRKDPSTGQRRVFEVLVDSMGRQIPDDELESEQKRSTKDTTEYVVVQRAIKHSKPTSWTIWGTTEETTVPKLRQLQKDLETAAALQAEARAKK